MLSPNVDVTVSEVDTPMQNVDGEAAGEEKEDTDLESGVDWPAQTEKQTRKIYLHLCSDWAITHYHGFTNHDITMVSYHWSLCVDVNTWLSLIWTVVVQFWRTWKNLDKSLWKSPCTITPRPPPPFKNMPDLPMMQMCAINLFPIMWEMGLVCLTFCEFP